MMQPGPGRPMSVPTHETAQNRRMIFCQILPRLVLNLHFKSYTLNLGVFFFAPNNSSYMQIFQLFLFVERVFDVYLFCDRSWTAPFGHWLAVPLAVRGNSQDRCVGRRRRSFFFFLLFSQEDFTVGTCEDLYNNKFLFLLFFFFTVLFWFPLGLLFTWQKEGQTLYKIYLYLFLFSIFFFLFTETLFRMNFPTGCYGGH
jgi:hypothetical protein